MPGCGIRREARASLPETYASTAVRREVYAVAEWLQPFNTGPKRKTYARPSEGAEGANALGLKNAKPVPRDDPRIAPIGLSKKDSTKAHIRRKNAPTPRRDLTRGD